MSEATIDALPDKPGYIRIAITEDDYPLEEAGEIAEQIRMMVAQARRLLRDASHSKD